MASIAILGGTGPLGRGLARRLAAAGHTVTIGSRDAARAEEAAGELSTADATVAGATNQDAVDDSEIVLVAVPYEALRATVDQLTGLESRLVVSCVNPLEFDDRGPRALPVDEGSAAEVVAAALTKRGSAPRVTAAFHHLSAPLLLSGTTAHDETVLVVGDDADDKATVCALAGDVVAMPGVDAGPLRNAQQIEAMTAVLIAINKRYRTRAGLAITGLGNDHN
ncbi:MAG: NADPH-dependent F420 reductase [Nitriliruptoraceae bacterium]